MSWRRKVLNPLVALVSACAGLAALQLPASAGVLALSNFQLRPASNAAELRARVSELDGLLPRTTVSELMGDLNRFNTSNPQMSGGPCEPAAMDGSVAINSSICFEEGDNTTHDWYPQGVTTVADAQGDRLWGASHQPVLVSWYDKNKADGDVNDEGLEKGVRISFMNPQTGSYRHVLLVYPFTNASGNPSYMSVRAKQNGSGESLHAGGIVWYGNFLYVADTGRGFRVFDMRHIYNLGAGVADGTSDTSDKTKIGRQSGVYYGHGYKYVMPQVAAWTHTAPTGDTCSETDGSPQFSYASLDRSGVDHLVAGEYCKLQWATNGRVAAWPIADSIRNGEQIIDANWNADAAYNLPWSNIQGATRFAGKWYLSQSDGASKHGNLYRTSVPSSSTGTLAVEKTQNLPIGPEDLSHWHYGTTSAPTLGQIWTVSEHPSKRMVYAVSPY